MLSHDQIIARLAAAGVKAVVCPACGMVREVAEDRICPHGLPRCAGSGFFVEPPPNEEFDAIVAEVAEEIEMAVENDQPTDWAAEAMHAIERHLEQCFEAVECSEGRCEHDPAGPGVCPESPALAPFDGCVTCIARESLAIIWPYACNDEVERVMNYLLSKANHPAMNKPTTRLLEQVVEHLAADAHREADACHHREEDGE